MTRGLPIRAVAGACARCRPRRRCSDALGRASRRVHVVGGAVRDLLLGRALASTWTSTSSSRATRSASRARLAERSTASVVHDRFGTATVRAGGHALRPRARARTETYARPGALPDVRPGHARGGPRCGATSRSTRSRCGLDGELLAAGAARARGPRGRRPARAARASFVDDPTRLLRLARYAAGWASRSRRRPRALATRALAAGALRTVSGGAARRRAAAGAAASRPGRALACVAALAGRALAPGSAFDRAGRSAALRAAAGAAPGATCAARRRCLDVAPGALRRAARRARLPRRATATGRRGGRAAPARSPRRWPRPRGRRRSPRGSRRAGRGGGLAGAPAPRAAARRWIDELRHVRLEIDGDDLLAAGVPQGPRRSASACAAALRAQARRRRATAATPSSPRRSARPGPGTAPMS